MIALIYAHPYPDRSCVNHILVDAVRKLPHVNIRSLYELYPDFSIDVAAEQAALREAHTIVWQHPFYWYSAPALMKLWFEKVLAMGWAYGEGGNALRGKRVLWVTTTGSPKEHYTDEGPHAHSFDAFEPVMRQTARFCGMEWLTPLVFHGAHRQSEASVYAFGEDYRLRLQDLAQDPNEVRNARE